MSARKPSEAQLRTLRRLDHFGGDAQHGDHTCIKHERYGYNGHGFPPAIFPTGPTLDALVDRGWVVMRTVPVDAVIQVAVLTDEGRRALRDAQEEGQ